MNKLSLTDPLIRGDYHAMLDVLRERKRRNLTTRIEKNILYINRSYGCLLDLVELEAAMDLVSLPCIAEENKGLHAINALSAALSNRRTRTGKFFNPNHPQSVSYDTLYGAYHWANLGYPPGNTSILFVYAGRRRATVGCSLVYDPQNPRSHNFRVRQHLHPGTAWPELGPWGFNTHDKNQNKRIAYWASRKRDDRVQLKLIRP